MWLNAGVPRTASLALFSWRHPAFHLPTVQGKAPDRSLCRPVNAASMELVNERARPAAHGRAATLVPPSPANRATCQIVVRTKA